MGLQVVEDGLHVSTMRSDESTLRLDEDLLLGSKSQMTSRDDFIATVAKRRGKGMHLGSRHSEDNAGSGGGDGDGEGGDWDGGSTAGTCCLGQSKFVGKMRYFGLGRTTVAATVREVVVLTGGLCSTRSDDFESVSDDGESCWTCVVLCTSALGTQTISLFRLPDWIRLHELRRRIFSQVSRRSTLLRFLLLLLLVCSSAPSSPSASVDESPHESVQESDSVRAPCSPAGAATPLLVLLLLLAHSKGMGLLSRRLAGGEPVPMPDSSPETSKGSNECDRETLLPSAASTSASAALSGVTRRSRPPSLDRDSNDDSEVSITPAIISVAMFVDATSERCSVPPLQHGIPSWRPPTPPPAPCACTTTAAVPILSMLQLQSQRKLELGDRDMGDV